MTTPLANFKWPAFFGALLTLPFMLLEWINRRAYHEPYPIPLFALLWLFPAAFLLIITPILRDLRLGVRNLGNPLHLVLKIVLLVLIAWMWTGILADQLPCFLGVQYCD